MEEKFDLKHNSYLVFMLNYAPIVIIGIIAVIFFHSKINNTLEYLLVAGIFFAGCWKGFRPLKNNKRFLVITDKNITVCKYKRKQPVVINQFNNDSISKIDASNVLEAGAYLITKNDNTAEILEISTGLKPDKELVLKINTALYKAFGEKFYLEDKKEIEEYINTSVVPKTILDNDKGIKNNRIAWCCINTIIGFLPTLLGILAVLWVFFRSIQFVLEMLLKIMGN